MKTRWETCVLMLLVLVAGVLLPAQGVSVFDISGEWQGMAGPQHLLVKIARAADVSFTGTLTAVDQGNTTFPVDSVSFSATGAFKFELKTAGVVYEAQLNDDGSTLVGTWHQGGNSVPVLFRRPGAGASKFTLTPRTLGTVPLEPCRTPDGNTEGLCGKYEVYENRALRSGRKIALNIMVLPALAAKPASDPWFPLAGGPGQSAVQSFPLAGFTTKVRQERDVILIDQRGTGQSNVLQCALQSPDDPQAVLGQPYSPEKLRECRTESDKKADPKQYTTSIAADDLDEVRQAMGYDKINVFGASYGTKAALVYLRLHGNRIRTVTLEAVASPQFLIPMPFAKGLQSSVDGVIALCVADAACHKDYPDLASEFKTVVDRLEKSPAQFQVRNQSVSLSREMFVSRLRSMLYVPQFVSAFPLIIRSAYQGNWSIYGDAAMSVRTGIEGMVARGAFFSAICAEDVPAYTKAAIRRETQGTYLGDSKVRHYQTYCEAWGAHGSVPKDFYAPVRSEVPTLLISGALDPATPPESARQAAHDLVNSRLIIVKEGTHGTGSRCTDGLIADFVKQGTTAGLNGFCADQIHLPPFQRREQ